MKFPSRVPHLQVRVRFFGGAARYLCRWYDADLEMSKELGGYPPVKHEDRIVRDTKICGGEPVFQDTRVTLRTVLASLAAGDSVEEILGAFPVLKPEDVQAAIAFAAASAEEDLPVPATPHIR